MKFDQTTEWTELTRRFYEMGYKKGYLDGVKRLKKAYTDTLRRFKKHLDDKFNDSP